MVKAWRQDLSQKFHYGKTEGFIKQNHGQNHGAQMRSTSSSYPNPSVDIVINLCLDLFINFFEELRIMNVTLIIFLKTTLDFSKILFNPRDFINIKSAKSIDQRRAKICTILLQKSVQFCYAYPRVLCK